jgi:alanine-glyoxylate transaminase/serine-glyoxylate transaminase/serine-pyruvate transaminase
MDDIKAGIQYIFQTQNPWTLALSGPGHLAMEAIMGNLLEPDDTVVIGVHGIWGERATIMAERAGARVHQLKKTAGSSFTREEIAAALENNRPKLLFLIHSESSTGVMQNLEGIGELCHR